MRLYNSSEIIKKTGAKHFQLKYWEETGKVVPVSRTSGIRHYSEEQLFEIMQILKKPMEVVYVCADCRASKDISINDVTEKLQQSSETVKKRIEALGINPAIFMVDLMLDDMENSNFEKLVNQAKEGLVSKVYIASAIGFPVDLVAEYMKWFKYLGVEVIDITVQEEKTYE